MAPPSAAGLAANGSVLGYMVGQNADVSDEVFHDFNLVLVDDPAHDPSDPTSSPPDAVDMLNRWHQYITGWVFGRVFGMMSSSGSPMQQAAADDRGHAPRM